MSDDNNLTGYEYDGIQEYDNPLPNWWLATFIGTVIFGFLYWTHYQLGGGATQDAELAEDMKKIAVTDIHQHRHTNAIGEEELLKLMGSKNALVSGVAVYQSKCASCHGDQLQGLIGPNLVDDYWLHGQGSLAEIRAVVAEGVPEKGMPNWDSMLKADEISAVTIFIGSNRGTQPPSPKPPQGEKVVKN